MSKNCVVCHRACTEANECFAEVDGKKLYMHHKCADDLKDEGKLDKLLRQYGIFTP